MRRQLGRATADYLTRFQAKLRKEFDQLKRPAEFCIDIEYRVVLTKTPDRADICLTAGAEGVPTRIVQVPKDPSISHPYRQKEMLEQLNLRLDHTPRSTRSTSSASRKSLKFQRGPISLPKQDQGFSWSVQPSFCRLDRQTVFKRFRLLC